MVRNALQSVHSLFSTSRIPQGYVRAKMRLPLSSIGAALPQTANGMHFLMQLKVSLYSGSSSSPSLSKTQMAVYTRS